MTRLRLLAPVAAACIVVLWAAAALAGTITSPTAPFTVPLDAAGTGPAPFKITASGYSFPSSVYVMVCDGSDPAGLGWDPSINCDNGTSPQQAPVKSDGTAQWDPAVSKNQAIGIFDGESPSSSFNCYYPGETAFSNGQTNPANSLPSWTNCQIRVASTNGAVTGDQAFLRFTLPVIGAAPTTTTTGATTTTIGAATTTTTVGATTTTSGASTTTTTTTSGGSTTTTTTSGGSTTTTTDGGSTTTTSTIAGGSTTSSTRRSGTSTTGTTATGAADLAFTGGNAALLVLISLCLLAIGFIVRSRGQV